MIVPKKFYVKYIRLPAFYVLLMRALKSLTSALVRPLQEYPFVESSDCVAGIHTPVPSFKRGERGVS